MVGPIRWIWAFLDTPSPDAARSWAYWAQVTGTTLSTPRGDHGEVVTLSLIHISEPTRPY